MVISFVVEHDLKLLKWEASKSRLAAFAESTRKNQWVQWRAYVLFCSMYELNLWTASADNICVFAQFLARSFSSMEAVANYVLGLRTLHVLLGLRVEAFDSAQWQMVKKGLKRRFPHKPRQASPISPEILLRFVEHMDLTAPLDATMWALFLVAFFGMLRKSNLVPDSAAQFRPDMHLQRKDVEVGERCLLITCSWSKTIQFGERK